jgi:hypothetical protein
MKLGSKAIDTPESEKTGGATMAVSSDSLAAEAKQTRKHVLLVTKEQLSLREHDDKKLKTMLISQANSFAGLRKTSALFMAGKTAKTSG